MQPQMSEYGKILVKIGQNSKKRINGDFDFGATRGELNFKLQWKWAAVVAMTWF